MTAWSRCSPGPGTPHAPKNKLDRRPIETLVARPQTDRTVRDRAPHPAGADGGSGTPELAIAVAEAGGLGSFPRAILGPDQMRADVSASSSGWIEGYRIRHNG
jgi:hypothetical protein